MARPREFDLDVAVSRAQECFRLHGYAGSSLDALLEATGIGKASFYAAFGSKHDLYLKALKLRSGEVLSFFLSRLEQRDVKRAVREVLHGVATAALEDDAHAGCLLTNAANEVCAFDADARAIVGDTFQLIEDAFYRALQRARADGSLKSGKNPRALARFFLATIQGLRVLGKVQPAPEISDVVESAMLALG